MKILKIETSFGGPCVYKRAVFEDGRRSGRIQDVGQDVKELERQMIESINNGRDDVSSFCDRIVGRS